MDSLLFELVIIVEKVYQGIGGKATMEIVNMDDVGDEGSYTLAMRKVAHCDDRQYCKIIVSCVNCNLYLQRNQSDSADHRAFLVELERTEIHARAYATWNYRVTRPYLKDEEEKADIRSKKQCECYTMMLSDRILELCRIS